MSEFEQLRTTDTTITDSPKNSELFNNIIEHRSLAKKGIATALASSAVFLGLGQMETSRAQQQTTNDVNTDTTSSYLKPGMLADPEVIRNGELYNQNINSCQLFILHNFTTPLISGTRYSFARNKKTGTISLKLTDNQEWGPNGFMSSCSYASDPYAQVQIVKKKKIKGKVKYTPISKMSKPMRVLKPGYKGGDRQDNIINEWHSVRLKMKKSLSMSEIAKRAICIRLKTTVAPRPEHTMPSQEWANKYNNGYVIPPPTKTNPSGYPDPVKSKSGIKIHCLTQKNIRR